MQLTLLNVHQTTYVHPWVEKNHIRWFVSDFVVRRVLWFLTGEFRFCVTFLSFLSRGHRYDERV
jgi:hypothetical protein